MKQLLTRQGKILVEAVPSPLIERGHVLVEVAYSVISSGTEISGVKAAGRSLVGRTLDQPEKVRKVLDHFAKHGLRKTVSLVRGELGKSSPLGYSCSGVVIAAGEEAGEFRVGDKVACAGGGKANHAEIVLVPRNLVVKVPDGCALRDAASVSIGSIALQGVRRADPTLGEMIAVIGLGLLGQIAAQILKAAGCRVVGFDIDRDRVQLAQSLGAHYSFVVSDTDYPQELLRITGGHGVDAAVITAASQSNEIIQQAMEITRKKGRVVVVGAVGLGLKRSPFYEKEIDLLISCSYGPGRYDHAYEEKGLDYPYAYVRWTERRNMAEYLSLVAEQRVNVGPVLQREFPISEAAKAYEALKSPVGRPIGVVLSYDMGEEEREHKLQTRVPVRSTGPVRGKVSVAVVGAGQFAKSVHLPNLRESAGIYHLRAVVSATGRNARETAERFGAEYCSTNIEDVLSDRSVDMVLLATRHNLHAAQAIRAAEAGKAVFLEKPMATNKQELDALVSVLRETKVPFAVGFNRRFSPAAQRAREILGRRQSPMMILYRVNAGYLPPDHWTQTQEGGGRIIGEACHMFDLFNYFTDSEAEDVHVNAINPNTAGISARDNFVATLRYRDGSICTLTYTALGAKEFGKEHIEIHADGKTLTIDDFKCTKAFGTRMRGIRSKTIEKGHLEELTEFAKCCKGESDLPIPLEQLVSATEISFAVDEGIEHAGMRFQCSVPQILG